MKPDVSAFAAKAGISLSYASLIINGKRTPGREIAYQIYERTGEKFGHIANLTAREIETARRLDEKAAA